MAFRREAVTLEDGRPWGEVAEPWQIDDFAALDTGQFRHAYFERPRGHAKTFDLGTEAFTGLVLGPPGQRLYCAAADEDQARLLFEDVRDKFTRSPLLRHSVRVTQREIIVNATGSRLKVLSSDAPTAYGLRPDQIFIDELAEWRRRELWDSLWSATGKRPGCRMLVISTAGWDRASIAWEVREIAHREADWYFSARGPCAGWISQAWREQQKRTLPAHVYARLHEARWVEGVGAWLTAEEVDGIFADALPSAVGPAAIGLDLGVTRDAAVAAVVRSVPENRLGVVEAMETWKPRGVPVDIGQVEEAVVVLAHRFSAPVILDKWQAVYLGQRLLQRGVQVLEYEFAGDGRRKLFGRLLDLIRSRRLRSRPHEDLRRELLSLEVEETASGWRVDHKPGRHDDHVVAVALAAQHVVTEGVPVDLDAVVVGPSREHFVRSWVARHEVSASAPWFEDRSLD
jgi:hypothetical protein